MGASRISSRGGLRLLGTALSLLLCLPGCAAAKRQSQHTKQTTTRSALAATRPLPAGFLGLSLQYKALPEYAGDRPKSIDPAFLNLLRDIAPGQSPVLRFGGDSTDFTWWPVAHLARPPGVSYTLTPSWLELAHGMISDLGTRLILGVNLEADSVKVASTEANVLVNALGKSSIAGLEIGNEPELYSAFDWYSKPNGEGVKGRPPGWNESDFFSEFHRFAAAMPNVPLAGPASGSAKYLTNLGAFLRGEPKVKLSTFHAYPLKHCTASKVVTIPELLSPSSSRRFAQSLAPYVQVSHRYGKLARLDEMNGITCGGYAGVSDSFASALWILDTLFELDSVGVDGVNVQTLPDSVQEIFGPVSGDGGAMVVHPEFYGMMMFAQAAPVGSRLISVPVTPPAGVDVWGTRATDGTVRVTLINNRLSTPETLRLKFQSPGGVATVEQLRAPHIGSTSGVSLGGYTFGRSTTTGILPTAKPGALKAVGGTYVVRVPPATATLLTLSPTAITTASASSN